MIGTFGKLQNLLPNEMQNTLAKTFQKLEELKQTKDKTDDYLKPHNDEEKKLESLPDQSPYQLIDQKTDKLLREIARLNIKCSNPEVRKACGK